MAEFLVMFYLTAYERHHLNEDNNINRLEIMELWRLIYAERFGHKKRRQS